ncbi:hypothetical protein BH11PLA1_BH11PLA1_06660 [soil metagenome]
MRDPASQAVRTATVAAALATLGAAAVGGLVTGRMTADSATIIAVVLAHLASGVVCLVPMLGRALVPPHAVGLLILMSNGARTMLAIGAMMVLIAGLNYANRPVAFGVLSGATFALIAEGLAGVWLLNRRPAALLSSPSNSSFPVAAASRDHTASEA